MFQHRFFDERNPSTHKFCFESAITPEAIFRSTGPFRYQLIMASEPVTEYYTKVLKYDIHCIESGVGSDLDTTTHIVVNYYGYIDEVAL